MSDSPAPLVAYPEECAHTVIARHAARTPHATALVAGTASWTFADLEGVSNQIASYLARTGVTSEVVVGLHMDSSPLAMAAMLGVMKAAGAILPLDPAYPPARLEHMVRDAQPLLVITETPAPDVRLSTLTNILSVDDLRRHCTDESRVFTPRPISLDQLACVLYTSGTTGWPKGVARTHRSISCRLAWPRPPLDEVWCHNMSLSVGLSYERALAALMHGLTLVVVPDEMIKRPAQLAQAWTVSGTSFTTVVPTCLRQVATLDRSDLAGLARMRSIAVGGAQFPAETLSSLSAALPGTAFINGYGGSEAGSVVRGEVRTATASAVSIGSPVANATAYVLHEGLQPAPPGATGELYVGGPSLARGYLRRQALTAERFVANPFGRGDRLYRTGDLARMTSSGEIELTGRADRQVKVRGFRVELGEVEQALRDQDGIADAFVTAIAAPPETRLVAYVVFTRGRERSVQALREELRMRLVEYMVPATFVTLPELPRSPIGKVDSTALPPPVEPSHADVDDTATDDPIERQLLALWARSLSRTALTTRDNFVELGGDSVQAVEIVWAVRKTFGVDVPIEAVLDGTIASVAAEITHLLNEQEPSVAASAQD